MSIQIGDKVMYITTITGPNRYAIEKVLRGIWDGEQAILTDRYDPKQLQTIVRKKEWLIKP